MRSTIKHIVARTYKPWLTKYLSKTRTYQSGNIRLEIPPEVFHPGFFFSTNLLLNYVKRNFLLKGKRFLEPGSGSGLIAIHAARQGAIVTATDINPIAIEFLRKNSLHNSVSLTIIQSDLFQDIPRQQFDIIAINPPYYKKTPQKEIDYAWYCGENGEYFSNFFRDLGHYIHAETAVIMVLFDGCDMDLIEKFAAQNGFQMECVLTKQNLLEKNFIYKISVRH